jgi:hypothetical protein
MVAGSPVDISIFYFFLNFSFNNSEIFDRCMGVNHTNEGANHGYPNTCSNSDQNRKPSGCMIWPFITTIRKEGKISGRGWGVAILLKALQNCPLTSSFLKVT